MNAASADRKYVTNMVWGSASKTPRRPLLKTFTLTLLHESRLPTAIQRSNISKGSTSIYEEPTHQSTWSHCLALWGSQPCCLALTATERKESGEDDPLNWRTSDGNGVEAHACACVFAHKTVVSRKLLQYNIVHNYLPESENWLELLETEYQSVISVSVISYSTERKMFMDRSACG